MMQVFHSFAEAHANQASVCTIGAFDGVHRGHQQLIRTCVQDAHLLDARAVVITFHPHPRNVIGNAPMQELTTLKDKTKLIRELGAHALIVLPVTTELMRTTADEFIAQMRAHLNMRGLWIGADFALGAKRQGNAQFLSDRGRELGFFVRVMPPLMLGAAPVSSTRVREALARGDLADAQACLGRELIITN